ncbi:Pol polyprotein [Plakobranchus ocellatus]|uniref:Pol polyprotein n=1 Tax=Plakobranchus ocellatus TaxID=259542 RepID=A0AAV3YSP7_9GAST|nr:Pol polyprotein [Plakobranchus ocellatus]
MADDCERFLAIGKELGIKGEELHKFVEEKVEKCTKERKEKETIDREERKLEREAKIRLNELERDREQAIAANPATREIKSEDSKKTNLSKLPKLPNFNPSTDALDAYITRFETLADQAKWNEDEKFIALSNLITGDSLQVLHILPQEKKNYNGLKNALFIRSQYTEDFTCRDSIEGGLFGFFGSFASVVADNRYILVKMDHFTKWVGYVPLSYQIAETTAQVVVDNLICRLGCPLEIFSDQDRNFESGLFQAMCTLIQVHKVRTTSIVPRAMGKLKGIMDSYLPH